MSQIELFLLGKSRVKKSDGFIRPLSDSQPSLLLTYLATTSRRHHAGELKELFHNQLNKIRYELSRESEKLTGQTFDNLIQRETNDKNQTLSLQIKTVQLNTDIAKFQNLLQKWSQSAEEKWTKKNLLLLENALDLYNGTFAQNFDPVFKNYTDWLHQERNRYRHMAAWAMLQLMFAGWSKGSLSQASNFGQKWLQKEPECHLWTGWISYFLMCIAYWRKQPDSALAIYADYEANLKRQQSDNRRNRDIKRWEQIDSLVQKIQENTVPDAPLTALEWQSMQEATGIEIPPFLQDNVLADLEAKQESGDDVATIGTIPFQPDKRDLVSLLNRMGFGSDISLSLHEALRNRSAILEQIRNFWIEGYLETSLADVPDIDLRLRSEHGHVAGLESLFPDLGTSSTVSCSFRDIGTQFESHSRKLLLLGEPGSGKTTVLLYLAHYLLENAEADVREPIPIVFKLSSWNHEYTTLDDWLIEELESKYHVPYSVASRWIETDMLVLLFDGLDEVDPVLHIPCLLAINDFRARHGLVDIAVSCRKEDYLRIEEEYRIDLNGTLVIDILSDAQVEQFIEEAGNITTGMIHFIEKNPLIQDLLRSPLVLNLMVRAFHQDERGTLYEDPVISDDHLFTHYVTRMYQRRPGNKAYTLDETIEYLGQMAQKMEAHSQQDLHIELLQPSWLSKRNQEMFHHIIWIGSALLMFISSFLASTIGSFIYSTTPEVRPTESLFLSLSLMWLLTTRRELWRKSFANFIPGIMGAIGTFIHFYLFEASDNMSFEVISAFIRYASLSFIGSIIFSFLQKPYRPH